MSNFFAAALSLIKNFLQLRHLGSLFLITSPLGAAQAQLLQSNVTDVAALDIFQECDDCPEMIVLPMGEFLMGGPIGDSRYPLVMRDGEIALAEIGSPEIGTDERPVHRVQIDIPIAMGRNEVTYDQWMACVDDGGCGGHVPNNTIFWFNDAFERILKPVRGSHPVLDVSYLDTLSYVAWLNDKVGAQVYRLPTEAEWEYAARAGAQTRFAQGDELTPEDGNFYWGGEFDAKYGAYVETDLKPHKTPVPVEQMDGAVNDWGLRHMSGNVIEITRSCYTDVYDGWSTSSEWLRNSPMEGCKRVFRGGAYKVGMDFLRVASRGSGSEDARTSISGFRILREIN